MPASPAQVQHPTENQLSGFAREGEESLGTAWSSPAESTCYPGGISPSRDQPASWERAPPRWKLMQGVALLYLGCLCALIDVCRGWEVCWALGSNGFFHIVGCSLRRTPRTFSQCPFSPTPELDHPHAAVLAVTQKSPRSFALWAWTGHGERDGSGRAVSVEQLQIMPDIIRAVELSCRPRGWWAGEGGKPDPYGQIHSLGGNRMLELALTRSACHKLEQPKLWDS